MTEKRKNVLFQMAVILLVTVVSAYTFKARASANYTAAQNAMDQGNYEEAIALFLKYSIYGDSVAKAEEAQLLLDKKNEEAQLVAEEKYTTARDYMLSKNYAAACSLLYELEDYKDSVDLIKKCESRWRLLSAQTISAGVRCSVGVTEDNRVNLSTSDEFYGRSEIENWTDIVSVSACGEIVIGLHRDGTVVTATKKSADKYDSRINTDSWHNIVAISAGEQYVVGLKGDGTLLAASLLQPAGYSCASVNEWDKIVSIDTAWQCTVGLDQNGNIHIIGYKDAELLSAIEDSKVPGNERNQWSDIVAVSVGGSTGGRDPYRGKTHIVGLTKDGRVVAVGNNDFGQCNVSDWADIAAASGDKIIAISAGDYHTVALTKLGRVYTTQSEKEFHSSYRDIGEMSNIVEISAGYGLTLGLEYNGTVHAAGNKNEGQANVKGWNILTPVRE